MPRRDLSITQEILDANCSIAGTCSRKAHEDLEVNLTELRRISATDGISPHNVMGGHENPVRLAVGVRRRDDALVLCRAQWPYLS
jgi:hypothetical protein